MPLSSRREVTRFVHKKLLFRLRRMGIFFIIIIALVVYEVSHNYIAGYLALFGFLTGVFIGVAAGRRMHIISWDAETNKAVTKMDRVGLFILIAYLLFAVFRRWIFSYWFQGYALTAFSMSVGAGGMLGRLYFTRRKIRQVLREAGFLYPKESEEEDN